MTDPNQAILNKDLKKLKNKRGQGIGKDYTPFIEIHEFSSLGECCRSPSITVGRSHHLFSGLELAAFVKFDLVPRVIDIREQFPLVIEDTLGICQQLGIKHPQANEKLKIKGNGNGEKKLSVMTTDLLIDFDNAKPLAVNVKYTKDLSNKRTIEKLQIERSYWEQKGVRWAIFTEREISEGLKQNLPWLHEALLRDDHEYTDCELFEIIDRLLSCKKNKIGPLCAKLDEQYQLEPGFHISGFRLAVAKRLVIAPFDTTFYQWDTNMISLNNSCGGR